MSEWVSSFLTALQHSIHVGYIVPYIAQNHEELEGAVACGWTFGVSDGAPVTSYRSQSKAFRCLLCFFRRAQFQFCGRGDFRGSTMVPLGRKLASSRRLSVHTTPVSGTIWPQFAMQVLTRVANPSLGRGGRMVSGQ